VTEKPVVSKFVKFSTTDLFQNLIRLYIQNTCTRKHSEQSRYLYPALLKYVMFVDVFPTVSRQHGGPIPNGFLFHRIEQNVYWENCTYRNIPILIFVTARQSKVLGEGFLIKF